MPKEMSYTKEEFIKELDHGINMLKEETYYKKMWISSVIELFDNIKSKAEKL